MNVLLSTSALPLPTVHGGGFMYPRRTLVSLNGVGMPVIHVRIRHETREDSEIRAVLNLLEEAPVGATYTLTRWLDSDEVTDDTEEFSFTWGYEKVGKDCWAPLH